MNHNVFVGAIPCGCPDGINKCCIIEKNSVGLGCILLFVGQGEDNHKELYFVES